MSGPKRGLALRENTPEELAGARACIERHIPEGRYRDEITEAVFGEARPQRHASTSLPTTWVEARREWLTAVRAWVFQATGRVLDAHVPPEDEQAYIAATGNRFVPPPMPDGPPERRMVAAGPARRHVEYLLDAGMRQRDIERAAGVAHTTLAELLRRDPRGEIRQRTAERILAVVFVAPEAAGSGAA